MGSIPMPVFPFVFLLRVWWNWQTRYFEVVVEKSMQVQVLLRAPFRMLKTIAVLSSQSIIVSKHATFSLEWS